MSAKRRADLLEGLLHLACALICVRVLLVAAFVTSGSRWAPLRLLGALPLLTPLAAFRDAA